MSNGRRASRDFDEDEAVTPVQTIAHFVFSAYGLAPLEPVRLGCSCGYVAEALNWCDAGAAMDAHLERVAK